MSVGSCNNNNNLKKKKNNNNNNNNFKSFSVHFRCDFFVLASSEYKDVEIAVIYLSVQLTLIYTHHT